jgi:GNAT superfamily N-acetyltransferase
MNMPLMPVSPLTNLETTFVPEAVTVLPDLFARRFLRPLRDDVELSYGLSVDRARRPLVQLMDDEGLQGGELFLEREIHELWERHRLVGMLAIDASMQSMTGSYDVMVSLRGVYLLPALRGTGIGEALATRVGMEISQSIIQQLEFARSWGKSIRVFVDGDLQTYEGERFFQQLVSPISDAADEASAAGVRFELEIAEAY